MQIIKIVRTWFQPTAYVIYQIKESQPNFVLSSEKKQHYFPVDFI